jgi:hypothetical protein
MLLTEVSTDKEISATAMMQDILKTGIIPSIVSGKMGIAGTMETKRKKGITETKSIRGKLIRKSSSNYSLLVLHINEILLLTILVRLKNEEPGS